MGMNAIERRLSNRLGDIPTREFYPADMPDGQTIFAMPKNKPMRLYKKFKGLKWFVNMTRDKTNADTLQGNPASSFAVASHYHLSYVTLPFGYDAEISIDDSTVTVDAYTVGGVSNTNGYKMLRAGTVTGISIQYRCTSATTNGSLKAYVQKNKVNQSMYANGAVSSVSDDLGASTTSDAFTFAAGDRINVELQLSEGDMDQVKVEDIAILVEVQLATGTETV